MMATSKHLIKQQDEVFIGLCKRSPYIWQGNPWWRIILWTFALRPQNPWSRAARSSLHKSHRTSGPLHGGQH